MISVSKVARRSPLTISAAATLEAAARELKAGNVGCLVVVESRGAQRAVAGMITDRDIVVRACALGLSPSAAFVGQVMSAPAITVRPDEDLEMALEAMRRHGIRRLPVVDAYGELAGIVTLDDLLAEVSRHLATIAGAIESEQALALARRA
jgi:CBS domain-containing protein